MPTETTSTPTIPAPKPAAEPSKGLSTMENLLHGHMRPTPKKDEPKPNAAAPQPAPATTPEAAAPVAPAKEPEAKPKAAKKKAVARAPEPEPVDYDRIAESTARGITEGLRQPLEKIAARDTAPAADPLEGLDSEERERYETYKILEKEKPERYKGLADRLLNSFKAADEWEAEWKKAHPGEDIDENSKEFQDFIESIRVDVSESDYIRALAKSAAEPAIAKATEPLKERLKHYEEQERVRAEEANVTGRQIASAKEYFAQLGEDYKDVLDEAGNISRAAIKKLMDEDPVRGIAFQSAKQVEAFSAELYKLANGLTAYDAQNPTPMHAQIGKFVMGVEAEMKQLPRDQQVDAQGRRFATASEYAALPKSRQADYWKYTDDQISQLYAAEMAVKAKSQMEAEEKRALAIAEKRGFVRGNQPAPAPKPQAAAPKPAPIAPLPPSPTGASAPLLASPAANGTTIPKVVPGAFTKSLFGQR